MWRLVNTVAKLVCFDSISRLAPPFRPVPSLATGRPQCNAGLCQVGGRPCGEVYEEADGMGMKVEDSWPCRFDAGRKLSQAAAPHWTQKHSPLRSCSTAPARTGKEIQNPPASNLMVSSLALKNKISLLFTHTQQEDSFFSSPQLEKQWLDQWCTSTNYASQLLSWCLINPSSRTLRSTLTGSPQPISQPTRRIAGEHQGWLVTKGLGITVRNK